jgi:hypothetical protein
MKETMTTIGIALITGVPTTGGKMIMTTGIFIPVIMKEIIGKTVIPN